MYDLISGSFDIAEDAKDEPFIQFLQRQTAIPKAAINQWLDRLKSIEGSARLTDHGDLTFEFPVRKGRELLELDSLLRAAEHTDEYRPLMNFDWADMSSGQKMLLDLFARLYYADRVLVRSKRKYDSVCMLLDEPEVGFHPTWQRGWLGELMAFTKGFKGAKRFQFVIATNNPLSLSDVPGECVEYIGGRKEEPATFAANIHELLGDSFYLHDGFIGEFAKEKLEKLIKFLATTKARRTRVWNEENAWQTIELVGDKVIKQRLTDLYYQKYPGQLPTSESEIEKLKAKLAALEAGGRL